MTKRNRGVYEPEFRLLLVIPQLVFGCAGLYGFGITANNTPRYGWFWPDFFFALEVMGMVLGAVASALYIVDAHRDIAVEGFTCLLIFKNIFSFGLTYSGYGWLVSGGVKPVFMAISSVQVVVCCATAILCKSRRDILQSSDWAFKADTYLQTSLARRIGLSSLDMISSKSSILIKAHSCDVTHLVLVARPH